MKNEDLFEVSICPALALFIHLFPPIHYFSMLYTSTLKYRFLNPHTANDFDDLTFLYIDNSKPSFDYDFCSDINAYIFEIR